MSKLDELVRDLTKVGSIPKSEARRRILELVDLGKLEEREALKKMVEKNCRYFCKGKTTKQLPVCPHANLLNELNK